MKSCISDKRRLKCNFFPVSSGISFCNSNSLDQLKESSCTYHLAHRTEADDAHSSVVVGHGKVSKDLLHELDLTLEIRFSHTGTGVDQEHKIDLLVTFLELCDAALERFTGLLELALCIRVFRGFVDLEDTILVIC